MSDNARFFQAVEITTATYDRAAANYAERNETSQPHWGERMEQFVDLLAQAEGEYPLAEFGGRPGDDITLEEYLQFVPVLDAGCGPGRDSRALAGHGLPVLGVDLSQGMLDEAGARTPRRLRHGAIRYALMDLRALDLPDASCRGVWCSASLLHVPRRTAPRAMSELARVLRTGGPLTLFLKLRAQDGPTEEFVHYPFPEVAETPRFYAYYTQEEARSLVEAAGLTLLECASVPDARAPEQPGWVSVVARKS